MADEFDIIVEEFDQDPITIEVKEPDETVELNINEDSPRAIANDLPIDVDGAGQWDPPSEQNIMYLPAYYFTHRFRILKNGRYIRASDYAITLYTNPDDETDKRTMLTFTYSFDKETTFDICEY